MAGIRVTIKCRCKDCEYAYRTSAEKERPVSTEIGGVWCKLQEQCMKSEGFCSDGGLWEVHRND